LPWLAGGASVLGGAAAVTAVVLVGMSPSGSSGLAPTETVAEAARTETQAWLQPDAPQTQPALTEIESGVGWRLLLAADGLAAPAASEAILAISWDGTFEDPGSGPTQPRYVDVLRSDGRIALRVETGYGPMARLNPVNDTLLISDWVGDGASAHARVLVFALSQPSLAAELALPGRRVSFTTWGNAIQLSPDGRWLYWVEHSRQADPASCQTGGDEAVCDLMVVRAVDLASMRSAPLEAQMPRACAVPGLVPLEDSRILASCHPREGSQFVLDAAAAHGREMAPATSGQVPAVRFPWSTAGAVGLLVTYTMDGSLTGTSLVDLASGDSLAEQPLPDAFGIELLDERTALVLLDDGSLHQLDLYSGATNALPYAIEPGRQGLDVILAH
jgi:hypothetical protein